jgi:ABC-type nitrate/sulfonate/bicarbonate transport system permease component
VTRDVRQLTQRVLPPLVGTLIILAAVWVFTAHSSSPYVLSVPTMVRDFRETWLFSHFSSDFLPSVEHVLAGFAIAVVVGVAVGTLLGSFRTLRLLTEPLISLLRSVPVPALVPAAAVAFGLGNGMRIGVVALACLWPILLNTVDGVAEIDPMVIDTVRSYRISGLRRLFWITLPALSPRIFSACRISLSIGLLAMVISESVAASNGIGFFLINSQTLFRVDWMWASIIMLGLLGIVLNGILTGVERRWLRWYLQAQAGAR